GHRAHGLAAGRRRNDHHHGDHDGDADDGFDHHGGSSRRLLPDDGNRHHDPNADVGLGRRPARGRGARRRRLAVEWSDLGSGLECRRAGSPGRDQGFPEPRRNSDQAGTPRAGAARPRQPRLSRPGCRRSAQQHASVRPRRDVGAQDWDDRARALRLRDHHPRSAQAAHGRDHRRPGPRHRSGRGRDSTRERARPPVPRSRQAVNGGKTRSGLVRYRPAPPNEGFGGERRKIPARGAPDEHERRSQWNGRRAFVTAIRTIAAAQQASPARAAASGASAADATQQLYERHQRRILAYCVSRLRDRQEAEDAVQNTFVYAFKLLERGVVPHAELPWLFTIAHNVCRSRKRALWRRGRVEASTDLDAYQDVFSAPDRAEADDLAGLSGALASMPETQRRALLLREWQGLSYAEIAATL